MITRERFERIPQNIENGWDGRWEEYKDKRFDSCLDQLANGIRFGGFREGFAMVVDILHTLLIGNESISYDQYKKAYRRLNNIHEIKDEEGMVEELVCVLRSVIN